MKDLTVLIPTSPIPSHPSTDILDETISNIRKYTDAKIIILCDGVHQSLEHRRKDYEDYSNAVDGKIRAKVYGDCEQLYFYKHSHQAIMTKFALDHLVRTPLVMFCEHDTSPIGDIEFEQICDFVRKSDCINYIRFNIFHDILEEHQYLMIDKSPQLYEMMGGFMLRLVRTVQWSQRPHIAKSDWYRQILTDHFAPDQKSMIEDIMHSVVIESYKFLNKDIYGLAIYTPEGNQLRSYHSDGRKSDEKITYG